MGPTLLVSLRWDTEADLDLHVVIPNGTVRSDDDRIWSKPRRPPGQMVDAGAYKSGGILDFDSNANCVIDGRRQENVSWTVAPPSGRLHRARRHPVAVRQAVGAIGTVAT